MALHCCMIVWKNNKKPKKLFYQGKVPPFKIIYIYPLVRFVWFIFEKKNLAIESLTGIFMGYGHDGT